MHRSARACAIGSDVVRMVVAILVRVVRAELAPLGDGIDFLKTDAPSWLLSRYGVIVVSGPLLDSVMSLLEVRDKLERFAKEGGSVVITAGSLGALPGGLHGAGV